MDKASLTGYLADNHPVAAKIMLVYHRLQPTLRAAVEQSPPLWFLKGG